MRLDLVSRAAAVQRSLDKFAGRAFDWQDTTCLHLARDVLVELGHNPPVIPPLHSAAGAARALKRAGFASVADIFDSLFLPDVIPAMMVVGDIALLPGEEGFDAVVICSGAALIGWHGSDLSRPYEVQQALGAVTRAWRT